MAHECINCKVKDATPNWKDIEIYFENFNMYKCSITFQKIFFSSKISVRCGMT